MLKIFCWNTQNILNMLLTTCDRNLSKPFLYPFTCLTVLKKLSIYSLFIYLYLFSFTDTNLLDKYYAAGIFQSLGSYRGMGPVPGQHMGQQRIDMSGMDK